MLKFRFVIDIQTLPAGRFEEARSKAGVRSHRVHQPVDDDKYVYVTLDFDSLEEAAAFKSFERVLDLRG